MRRTPLRGPSGSQRFSRSVPARERFFGYVAKSEDPNGCWEWTGTRVRGYGQFVVDGKKVYAHRYAHELLIGPIPPGLDVLHACDNPCCVRPDHLRSGTHQENMLDASARGRMTGSVHRRKLTSDEVDQVRTTTEPSAHLAAKLGVSPSAIRALRRKKSAYRRRDRAVDYMVFVKRLPCSAIAIDQQSKCEGPIEADHAGRRGIGQKAHDSTVIPLCSKHHKERHAFSGAFKTWDQDKMRTWLAQRVFLTQRIAAGRGVQVPTEEAA